MERQWAWVADMNLDGLVTVRDVVEWLHWLFFYPGDYFVYLCLEFGRPAQFFELTSADYGGLFSFALSAGSWAALWITPKIVASHYRGARAERTWERKLHRKLSEQERRRKWVEKKDRRKKNRRRHTSRDAGL